MGDERSDTKVALMRAAEEIFAQYGIDGARAGDILRLADQANESAINYHFGSRWGLVMAIVESHLAEMEAQRVVRPGPLRDLVADLVTPAADRLTTAEGRHFLRIVNQVIDRAAPQSVTAVPPVLEGTALLAQITALTAALTHLEPLERLQRVEHFVVFHLAALATRARRIDGGAGEEEMLPHDAFVEDLVDLLTAVLAAEGKSVGHP